MKKRLLALALSLLCVLLLAAPVVAMSWQTEIIDTEVKLHRHDNVVAFRDTDTGKTGYVCVDCAQSGKLTAAYADKALIQTSADLRSACAHAYGDWNYHSTTKHKRACPLCADIDYDDHQITPADCTHDAYCPLCRDRAPTWEEAWGHELEFRFDYDRWVESGGLIDDAAADYYHGDFCIRQDEFGVPLCNHYENYEPCWMLEQWAPAENGVHEHWDQCIECFMVGAMWTEECDRTNPGDPCDDCDFSPTEIAKK